MPDSYWIDENGFHPKDWIEVEAWLPALFSAEFYWNLQALQEESLKARCLILREKSTGTLRAFLLWRESPGVSEIQVLAVDPQHFRQGLMSQLLSSFIAKRQNTDDLWLEVHERNLGARKLYEKFAFRKQGQRLGYYRDGGTALIYTRSRITPCEG